MMLGADPLGPRSNTITLREGHPTALLCERRAHYGIYVTEISRSPVSRQKA